MIIASVITLLFSKVTSVIQKRKNNTVNITAEINHIMASDDSTTERIKEPIYDDIELAIKTNTIDVSKNVAYSCTQNQSH